MSDSDAVLSFAAANPEALASAIQGAVARHGELATKLRAGAADSVSAAPTASATARRFQTFLELGYLVASADGFAPQERDALARLLEQVTDSAIDHAVLDEHFQDLDRGVAMLGRPHRLAASAALLEDAAAAEEAITLITWISLADGVLARDEYEVIESMGKHAGIDPTRVRALVDDAGARIGALLK